MRRHPRRPHLGRIHILPLAWAISLVSMVVIALALTGTLSGFTAQITNNANSAGTGSVIMTETSGGTTCYSNGASSGASIGSDANTCSINKLGGNLTMTPGSTQSVNVTITNSGTLPVATAFTLTPSGCSQSANGSPSGSDNSFCSMVDVSIWDSTDGQCVVPASAGAVQANCVPTSGTTSLASLGTTAINLKTYTGTIAAGGSRAFTITTGIDSAAANSDMNLQVSDNLVWAFTA